MSVSKINLTSYKNYLPYTDKNGGHYCNTDNIDYAINNKKDNKSTIPPLLILNAKDFYESKFGLSDIFQRNAEQMPTANRSNVIFETFRKLNPKTFVSKSIRTAVKTQNVQFRGIIPQKCRSSLCDEYGNLLTDGNKRKIAIGQLCDKIRNGELKITDSKKNSRSDKIKIVTVNQILDIWSWRRYYSLSENIQFDFFKRFNEICEESKIDVHDGEIFIRTIPVLGAHARDIEFSLGEPKGNLIKPAAAARTKKLSNPKLKENVSIEIEGKTAILTSLASTLPYEVIYRIIDDKQHWLSLNPHKKMPSSTVYIIEPQGYKTLTGFDWEKTGVVDPNRDGGNGFGSRVFFDHGVDFSSGLSTEVVFSGNTKFKMNPAEKIRQASIFYPGIGNIKIKIVYVIPTN